MAQLVRSLRFWFVLYLLSMAVVVVAGSQFRRWALSVYSTGAAQEQWDEWRDDVQTAQQQPQSVARRVPRSDAPPALVLMRDHYTACLTISLVLSSALFATFMLMIRGSLT